MIPVPGRGRGRGRWLLLMIIELRAASVVGLDCSDAAVASGVLLLIGLIVVLLPLAVVEVELEVS